MPHTVLVGNSVSAGNALTPDGSKLYAGNGLSNDVSVIDTRPKKLVAAIPSGNGPWDIAVRP